MAHLSHMPPFPSAPVAVPPLRPPAALSSAPSALPHALPPPRYLVPPPSSSSSAAAAAAAAAAAHHAAFSALPAPPFAAPRSLSDTSTRITELSPAGGDRAAPDAALALRGEAYIPILPRTNAHALYNKRCETCAAAHDGSFGAGRFCSSRCARTVGGLAHRKKRLMEREYKQKHAAHKRTKRLRGDVGGGGGGGVIVHERAFSHLPSGAPPRVGPLPCMVAPSAHLPTGDALLAPSAPSSMTVSTDPSAVCASSSSRQYRSPKSVMNISSLLNPSE